MRSLYLINHRIELLSILFAKRSCQTLSRVNLYPSLKNISTDDKEYTRKHLPVLQAMLIFTMESLPKRRLSEEDRCVDFDDSNNSFVHHFVTY